MDTGGNVLMLKKLIVICMLINLYCPCAALGTVLKEYYENGKVMAEMNFSFWQLDGTSRTYYENGKVMAEMNYKSGVQEGIMREYYESGKLKSEFNYKQDKKEGMNKQFYESGAVMEEELWKDGMPQNRKIYYQSGRIQEDWDYHVSSPDDLANVKYYNEDGALREEKILKQKKKPVKQKPVSPQPPKK